MIVKVKSNAFRRILIEENITTKAFATRAGVNAEHFCRVVNGHSCPSVTVRTKILDELSRIGRADIKFHDIFCIEANES